MSNFKLHDFVGRQTKLKKIKSMDLATMCGLSRTTLYRHTKGILPISPKVEAAMAKALRMNDAEREEFRRLISITVQDGSLISARFVLDRLFFGSAPYYANEDSYNDVMFAFHQNDSYLRKLGDITGMLLEHSSKEGFACDIKLVGCISKDLQGIMQTVLGYLLSHSEAVNVEHLLVFPKSDYLKCAETMLAIMPLIGYLNYNMLYDTDSATNSESVLRNFLLVKISYRKDGKENNLFYVISLVSEGLSQIAAFENEDIYRFFLENYQLFRKRCKDVWIKAKNISLLNDYLLALESTKPQCIIKASHAYNKIPIEAYKSIASRSPQSLEKIPMLKDRMTPESLFATLEARYNTAYKEGNWDVYTANGLRDFAEKGMLADHIDWMPAFDKNERKIILKSIRERLVKKPKGFNLLVTEKDIINTFSATADTGLLLKFDKNGDLCQNIFVENKMVADLVFDYVKNHLSAYHAMPEEDAIALFDELIAGLE